MHVEADPERAMAATAASSAQEASHDPAFAPVNGYTTETLLKDKRFKVGVLAQTEQMSTEPLLLSACCAVYH